MSSNLVDKLYDIYVKSNTSSRESLLKCALVRVADSGIDPVAYLTDYINTNARSLPSSFQSQEKNNLENKRVENIVEAFGDLSLVTDIFVDDLREQLPVYDYGEDEIDYPIDYEDEYQAVTPQDLFSYNTDTIREAYEKYKHEIPCTTPQILQQAISLISYVQEKKSLQRIYGSNEWKSISMDKLILTLRDFHKNKPELFDFDAPDITARALDQYHFLDYAKRINEYINEQNSLSFTKYRPSMISRSGITTNLDKVIFARNLIEFIKSHIIPTPNGLIDFNVDSYEEYKVVERFNKLYSRNFDNDSFKDMQSNFIFDVNKTILGPNNLSKIKCVQKGNSLAIGCLLNDNYQSFDMNFNGTYYLVHIFISDVTNDKSTYEIQFNVLPEGKIKHRVQIARLDNWKDEQAHRNLGNKLRTTTHIHLYNHLDLLRGKVNGAYDIAYNLSENSTDFDTSLQIFLGMITDDEKLQSKLYKQICRGKEKARQLAIEQERGEE